MTTFHLTLVTRDWRGARETEVERWGVCRLDWADSPIQMALSDQFFDHIVSSSPIADAGDSLGLKISKRELIRSGQNTNMKQFRDANLIDMK